MNVQHLRWLLVLGLLNGLAVAAMASSSNYASVQSTYKPLGWTLAAQVEVGGCDAAAKAFATVMPGFQTLTSGSLKEGVAFAQANNNLLDPQRLYFFSAYAPRIYFLSTGGWYTDALGVTIGTATAPNGKPPAGTNYTVFPNANSYYSNTDSAKQTNGQRTQFCPLLPGDFVQLPTVNAGQALSLVFMSQLDSNGNPANVFYNDPNANADKYQHMVAFFPPNSNYIIVGFEDLYGGGDKDYNDVVIVIDVGATNASLWQNSGTLPK
jgi:hypothetical protein